MSGTLFIVATPMGNLKDVTLRALQVLREVSVIVCEDQRVTKRLLQKYEITTPTRTIHQHSSPITITATIEILISGDDVALVTDAGTPGVADPGNIVVAAALRHGITVVPIPGPSAVTAILSVAGVNTQRFAFLGFAPHKKGRQTFFASIAASDDPVVYYDSPHRFIKNLELLTTIAPNKHIILGRELTKIHEEVVRGTPKKVFTYYKNNPDKCRGEVVVLVCHLLYQSTDL